MNETTMLVIVEEVSQYSRKPVVVDCSVCGKELHGDKTDEKFNPDDVDHAKKYHKEIFGKNFQIEDMEQEIARLEEQNKALKQRISISKNQ